MHVGKSCSMQSSTAPRSCLQRASPPGPPTHSSCCFLQQLCFTLWGFCSNIRAGRVWVQSRPSRSASEAIGLVDAVGCAPQQPLCRASPRHLLQHNCHNMLGSREAAGTRLLNGRQRMKKQKGASNRARQARRRAFPCTPPPDSFTRSPCSP